MNKLQEQLYKRLKNTYVEVNKTTCNGCPFTGTDESEQIQNYGCLPGPLDIMEMYQKNEGHWKCHSAKRKCGGLTQMMSNNDIPFDKNNTILITSDNP